MTRHWVSAEARHELRRGWKSLLACAVGLAFGSQIYIYVSSLFVVSVTQAFGWSRAALGGVLISATVAALFMPMVSGLINRFGPVRCIAFSVVASAASYGLLAGMTGAVWQYYLGYLLVVVLGAAAGPIGYTRIVISWFDHARGLALALTLSGAAIGGVLASPIVGAAIARFGFRAGFGVLALLCLVGGAISIGLGLKLGPVGQAPARSAATKATAPTPWREILKQPAFWLLGGAVFAMTAPATGMAAHVQPFFVSRGIPGSTAALLVSLLAASVLMGRVGTGFIIDRFWGPAVAAGVCVMAAAGAALLLFGGTSVAASVVGILLFGTAQGAELDLLCFLAARYFGVRAYTRVYGALFICFAFALPTGAVGFGLVFDRTGTYIPALGASVVLLMASAVLYLLMGPYPSKTTVAPLSGAADEASVPA